VPPTPNPLSGWLRSRSVQKIIRYTMNSVVTTVFSQVVLAILYGGNIVRGVVSATLVANLMGTVPSYHLNRRWAWQKKGLSHWRLEILPYWAISLSGIAFATLGALLVRHVITVHHWSHVSNTIWLVSENVASFVLFWVLKMLVFNRIFDATRPTS
jgi:putative flippase GtrA